VQTGDQAAEGERDAAAPGERCQPDRRDREEDGHDGADGRHPAPERPGEDEDPADDQQVLHQPDGALAASEVPTTSYTTARTQRLPGPYRWRKSRWGTSPARIRSGKVSMKPSSIGEPVCR
jgi:hypothetical protein